MPVRHALVALLALAATAAPAAAAPRDPRLAAARTFAHALGDGAAGRDLSGYDVVVVDGDTPAARVKQLRAGGAVVLGYLDVGTIEPYRSWYPAAKPYRLDYWPDWGEWYANVARPGFRKLILRRVAPQTLRRGFDGLFLDNVDMIETHRRQKAGMLALVRGLARLPGLLFAQNGDDVIAPFLPYLDGWNREDVTRTYDFDTKRYVAVGRSDHAAAIAALKRIGARGKLVTATDYVAAGDTAGARAATAAACAAGALSYVSDIDLKRVPHPAPRC
jgi:uncharacterized protein (TIGR01370 family)